MCFSTWVITARGLIVMRFVTAVTPRTWCTALAASSPSVISAHFSAQCDVSVGDLCLDVFTRERRVPLQDPCHRLGNVAVVSFVGAVHFHLKLVGNCFDAVYALGGGDRRHLLQIGRDVAGQSYGTVPCRHGDVSYRDRWSHRSSCCTSPCNSLSVFISNTPCAGFVTRANWRGEHLGLASLHCYRKCLLESAPQQCWPIPSGLDDNVILHMLYSGSRPRRHLRSSVFVE